MNPLDENDRPGWNKIGIVQKRKEGKEGRGSMKRREVDEEEEEEWRMMDANVERQSYFEISYLQQLKYYAVHVTILDEARNNIHSQKHLLEITKMKTANSVLI